ncbi:InlB B-repeat-containing protein [Treponema vincentii]|uniref:InlB B-repeat-containing protein n=1 Tax=Treponema vincentii TaxID=69710 RepID=UPI0020A2B7EB|nr:InlB B-repeat-containing protein [Treponema vincentii]UTC59128.1 InlB B-repeat-containing protein [Treponema vincentii]
MTECTKSLQRVGLRRSIWRKCLLAGSVLLAMSLFFSCQPNVPSGGNSDKTYTVNHNFARVESGYDVEKEELSGPVDSETKAAAKQKDGFELDKTKHTDGKIAQATIKADGSTVVDIYYARKEVTLTFKLNGGKFGESTDDKTMKGKFGEPLVKPEEPKQDGYTFTGWEPKLQGTFPAADTTYTAKWAKGELPKYTVNHWQQNINSETGTVYDSAVYAAPNYTCKEAETKHGYEGEQTQAEAKTDYDGFELDKTKHPDGKITQVTINADGSAVVDIYYVRKEVTLTFKLDGGKFGESTDDKTVKGKYGETKVEGKELKDYITKPEKDGMQFAGWNTDKVETPASFPSKDTEYTAQWETPKAGSYKVIHWKQPIVGVTYTEKEEESLNGTVGDYTDAKQRTYQGFHVSTDKHLGGKITQQKIEADGKTVIDIYYDRNIVTVTFKDSDKVLSSQSGRYEAKVLEPVTPEKEGHTFKQWNPAMPKTFPLENTECQAEWFAEVLPKYKVEHWLQAIDTNNGKVYDASKHENPNYIRKDTEAKSGKKDTQTAAKAKEYEGFDIPTVTQATIKADGSTVVKIYYVRKEVTLKFYPKGGTIGGSAGVKEVKGRFGETIQEADVSTPEKDDAVFDDWNPLFPLPSTYPDSDKEYAAQWKTVATLELKKAPDKTIYNKDEELNLAGLEFNVKYAEGGFKLLKPELITGKYGKYTVSGFDPATTGEQTVTVTYKKATLTFKVTVQETPSSQTFAIGDIIDSTDSKVYKPAAFKISKSWDKYYVIIKVEGTKYTGVRYFDNTGYGDVELGISIANTYTNRGQPDSSHRYLSKDEVTAIFANKDTFTSSIKKIKSSGIPTNFDKQNVIYKVQDKHGNTAFFNGNDKNLKENTWLDRDILPIIARDFNIN